MAREAEKTYRGSSAPYSPRSCRYNAYEPQLSRPPDYRAISAEQIYYRPLPARINTMQAARILRHPLPDDSSHLAEANKQSWRMRINCWGITLIAGLRTRIRKQWQTLSRLLTNANPASRKDRN